MNFIVVCLCASVCSYTYPWILLICSADSLGVQIGTSPFSVGVELSAVPILAWSGVGCLDFCHRSLYGGGGGRGGGHKQNHDWTAPTPPWYTA